MCIHKVPNVYDYQSPRACAAGFRWRVNTRAHTPRLRFQCAQPCNWNIDVNSQYSKQATCRRAFNDKFRVKPYQTGSGLFGEYFNNIFTLTLSECIHHIPSTVMLLINSLRTQDMLHTDASGSRASENNTAIRHRETVRHARLRQHISF